MEKKHIVVDCDEVIVNISPMIVALLHDKESGNFDYYNKYLRLTEDFDIDKHEERILSRPSFNVINWLIRENIKEKYSNEEIDEFLDKAMQEVIFHPELYDHLQPTPIAKSLAHVANSTMLDKISIVTRTSDNNLESKERFLKKLFRGNMNKVDIYYVEPDENKSDVICNLGDNIAAIYDDEISNVEDIVFNCDNVKDLQFLIPSFGYNTEITQELFDECKRKNIEIKNFYYKTPMG